MQHCWSLNKTQCPLEIDKIKLMSSIAYTLAIGSIMYALICTWPDILYALRMYSRYQSNLGDAHWNVAKNILKYLRIIKDHFLVYGGESELRVEGYTDASLQTKMSFNLNLVSSFI